MPTEGVIYSGIPGAYPNQIMGALKSITEPVRIVALPLYLPAINAAETGIQCKINTREALNAFKKRHNLHNYDQTLTKLLEFAEIYEDFFKLI